MIKFIQLVKNIPIIQSLLLLHYHILRQKMFLKYA